MKNKRTVLSCLTILLAGVICFPVLAQQKNDVQDVVYQLDVQNSKLFWKAPKNRHNGFILFNSGTLNSFTAGKPTRGTFSINMNSMKSTDEASVDKRQKVDDKLRSEEFFAVSKYPAATMLVKNMLAEQPLSTYRVSGELTIKGVTNPIEFKTIMKQNGSKITATASMTIDRKKWNINHQPEQKFWNPFDALKDHLVDDDILVNLELVFIAK